MRKMPFQPKIKFRLGYGIDIPIMAASEKEERVRIAGSLGIFAFGYANGAKKLEFLFINTGGPGPRQKQNPGRISNFRSFGTSLPLPRTISSRVKYGKVFLRKQ